MTKAGDIALVTKAGDIALVTKAGDIALVTKAGDIAPSFDAHTTKMGLWRLQVRGHSTVAAVGRQFSSNGQLLSGNNCTKERPEDRGKQVVLGSFGAFEKKHP